MMQKPVVLIVDDEPHIVRVVALKLCRAGLDVLTAHNGLSALETLRKDKVDLLITDHQMPDITGLDLAKRTASNELAGHTPIIMLTARDFALSDSDVADTNIVCVMNKPFSPSKLLGKVNELIGCTAAESNSE